LPVVIGGDHSCAIGTWKGIARALAPRGPLGLVWIDAHMDAHTPETSPSGMLHGMPLACLLGHGDPRLALEPAAALDPGRLCLVGVRSFESGEASLLERLGVRVFRMREIERRGLAPVMAEALAIARNGSGGYGVSLDLDAIDPRDAPGVGTAVRHGIRAAELRELFGRLAQDPALDALEIAEYNPARDRGGATARLIGDIVLSLLAPARPELALAA
jgi:arginase